MLKKLFLATIVLSLVSVYLNGACSDKTIFSSDYTIASGYEYTDRTLAYNDAASCATLSTDTNKVCCYLKIKFENENNEEKYTHKGCIDVDINYVADNDAYDIDDFIDSVETYFDSNNTNTKLVSKSISVDCSSKYLQLFGLAFLILLL